MHFNSILFWNYLVFVTLTLHTNWCVTPLAICWEIKYLRLKSVEFATKAFSSFIFGTLKPVTRSAEYIYINVLSNKDSNQNVDQQQYNFLFNVISAAQLQTNRMFYRKNIQNKFTMHIEFPQNKYWVISD